jgi:hypothetical protein
MLRGSTGEVKYLGSKRAQGRPLVAEGCGALLKMPIRSTKNKQLTVCTHLLCQEIDRLF